MKALSCYVRCFVGYFEAIVIVWRHEDACSTVVNKTSDPLQFAVLNSILEFVDTVR